MNNDGFNIKISKVSLEGVSIPDVQSLIDAKFGDKLKLNVGVNIDNQQFKNIQTQLDSIQKLTGKDISGSMNSTASSLQEIKNSAGEIVGKTETWKNNVGGVTQEIHKAKKGSTELEHSVTKTTISYEKQAKVQQQLVNFQTQMNTQITAMQGKYGSLVDSGQINKLKDDVKGLTVEGFSPERQKQIKNTFDQIKVGAQHSASAIRTAQQDARSFGDEIIRAGVKFGQWMIIGSIIMQPVRAIKEAIQEIKTLDNELTQLRKVTGDSVATMAEFAKTANEIGIAMGASTVEVTKAAVEFARLGMSIEKSSVMAEKSILLGTVGQMSVEDASKALISTTKAFGIQVDKEGRNVVRVIDLINEVGKNLPLHIAMCG